jgi:hypothetical protein
VLITARNEGHTSSFGKGESVVAQDDEGFTDNARLDLYALDLSAEERSVVERSIKVYRELLKDASLATDGGTPDGGTPGCSSCTKDS